MIFFILRNLWRIKLSRNSKCKSKRKTRNMEKNFSRTCCERCFVESKIQYFTAPVSSRRL